MHLAPDGEPHVVRFNADEARRGRISQLAPSMPRAIILPEHGWHVTAEAVKFCLVHNIALASVAARTPGARECGRSVSRTRRITAPPSTGEFLPAEPPRDDFAGAIILMAQFEHRADRKGAHHRADRYRRRIISAVGLPVAPPSSRL